MDSSSKTEDIFAHVPRKKAAPRAPYDLAEVAPGGKVEATEDNSSTAVESLIPRKKKAKVVGKCSQFSWNDTLDFPQDHPNIQLVSNAPLILRIKVPRGRYSSASKRHRSYKEMQDTDSDDIMTEEEEQMLIRKRKQKRRKNENSASTADIEAAVSPVVMPADPTPLAVEAPPPGTLSTLWYSREVFLNIFSMEKVYGWKTRPKVELVVKMAGGDGEPGSASSGTAEAERSQPSVQHDDAGMSSGAKLESQGPSSVLAPGDAVAKLDVKAAERLQGKILRAHEVWSEEKQRMEVSRINPLGCPMIAQLAAAEKPQQYEIRQEGFEEVILIKWRGRSHLHCSWERASDVQRLDPSTSNSAKAKVKRFYQSQEAALGRNWKAVIAEQRRQNETLKQGRMDTDSEHNGEEYYSPQYIEIERILSCDESNMEMDLFAKQRALNLVDDRTKSVVPFRAIATKEEEAWDPEDNVRYVVKWKGLPFAEVTWEYWRDIKYDAVDEAEDFWLRQRAPTIEEAEKTAKRPRPHMKLFKQIRESREYGISKIPRPVANLEGRDHFEDNSEEAGTGFRLRSYQLEGLNWLLFNWWNRRSCILADEMGLGKTIQSAAFLQELQLQPAVQVSGPFLIVAPLSLVTQWQSELKSWAPDMNIILFHGSAEAREFLVENEFYYNSPYVAKPIAARLKKLQITKFNVLITTYEVVMKDINLFSRITWKALILDEAHRIKNHRSKLFEELTAIPRDHCVLLTGTPIANATEELWALLHFANPEQFDNRESFLQKFGEMTGANQVDELHNLLKPYLLRRVKEDVEKSLPNKEETILEITLTPIQKKFYKAIYERNTSFLFKGAKAGNTPSLMNVMMELRKCCNHPFLIQGAEELILKEAAVKANGDEAQNNVNSVSNALYFDQLIKSSGKMVLLDKLLQKLFIGGHKVLIFSQMVRVLDLLEEFLKLRGYKFERLDGSTSASSRLHAVDRFKRKACQRFVMLLSTRAGGLGLNLTTADIVVIFDSDWNPQNDLQAMARAHRIGQTRAVKVYRLLTAKTYEMHMFHSASLKLGLERAVLSQNRESADQDGAESLAKTSKKESREAQAKEIDQLLKKGAYDVFRDDDDQEAAEKFMESDIDQLLEHSSKQVTYGKSATSSIGSGLGSFSKASFVASTESGEKDVDLDDPDFWTKAVGLDTPQDIPEELNAMLDDGVKRVRKQVQQYDPYADIAKSEQLRKDRIAAEKEEKERIKEAKKQKKLAEIEEKRRKKEEKAMTKRDKDLKPVPGNLPLGAMAAMVPKLAKKTKKSTDRSRAIRKASHADPVIERLKQAWEIPQRNRVTAAIVRFGFGRFTKIRSEANLTSIPLQDIEVFSRSYMYQITLQVAVSILMNLQDGRGEIDLNGVLLCWTGEGSVNETRWLREAILGALSFQTKVECDTLPLRMPWILTEPTYVEELRHGAGLRALRRVHVASLVNHLVEECVDAILLRLGSEELGKRGCGPNETRTLDTDLKARFVTTEELMLAVSKRLCLLDERAPSIWWDRSCDVGLVVGSFIHGLGCYEAMKSDPTMPFRSKITHASVGDMLSTGACRTFARIVAATRQVFDDALESNRIKAELEVQRTIAEAAKAASEREEAAALVRKGGVEAEVVAKRMPDTQVINAFEFDGSDSHFVTLPRLHERVQEVIFQDDKVDNSTAKAVEQKDQSLEPYSEASSLPMPDGRILDCRLYQLLVDEERPKQQPVDTSPWEKSSVVEENIKARSYFMHLFHDDWTSILREYAGIGLGGNQCAISHRALNDGADYGFGSAAVLLSHLAYGTDAPRYLRALGVPMNITRAALIALAYSRIEWVDDMLNQEKMRFFGKDTGRITTNQNKEKHTPTEPAKEASNSITGLVSQENQQPQPSVSGPTEALLRETTQPIDPVSLIELSFRGDSRLRAHVCMVVLFLGYPQHTSRRLNPALYADDSSNELFGVCEFRSALVDLSPDLTIPRKEALHEYIEHFLLPHCVRLCVSGNGPSTRNARGSQGDFETSFGINIHPEPSKNYPSPIPDPCLPLQEHSHEAVNVASAILRRVRLVRSCTYLCSVESENDLPNMEEAATTLESIYYSIDMPIWWQPRIHDVALLLEAASRGLFSICQDRPAKFSESILQQDAKVVLQASCPDAPHEQLDAWVDQAAKSFPSLYQMERRLGAFCSVLTKTFDRKERFPYLPMFDHGSWPRK